MAEDTGYIYQDTMEFIDCIVNDYDIYQNVISLMSRRGASVALNQKVLQKQIDETWVKAIEDSLGAIDHIIRNPGRDIKEEEEVLPIELSRNITARSMRHLAQHTDYIKKIENGVVTPSKILNVYKEETLETYENKFVNTLIDRLYLFIHRRYDKLAEYGQDEAASELTFNTDVNLDGTNVKLSFSLETRDEGAAAAEENPEAKKASLWERIERLRRIVDEYKGSSFVASMKNAYIRPPVMRTNAIMKNQELKQCLVLWQFIESYDKAGFDIHVEEAMEKPEEQYISELYALFALQYVIFRYHTEGGLNKEAALRTRRSRKPVQPRIIRRFEEEMVDEYNFYEVEQRKVMAVFPNAARRKLSPDEVKIKKAIDIALAGEKKQRAEERKREKERLRREQKKAR